MNLHLRLLWLFFRTRRAPRTSAWGVVETNMRVRLRDLDIQRHVNNAV
jgi:acyl-ACP thioesterase